MDTIRMYLDNLFMNLPQSEKVLRAKEELLSMMEDKYQELKASGKSENEAVGMVIAEFGNLEDAAGELGITSEVSAQSAAADDDPVKLLPDDLVENYLSTVRKCSKMVALGVWLCICSPILLILLGGLGEFGVISINEEIGGIVGLVVLFVMVTAAVVLFIVNGTMWEKFDYLKKQNLRLTPSMEKRIRQEQEAYQPKYLTCIAGGVGLCILAVIPLFLSPLFPKEDIAALGATGILLFLVSVGVYLMIRGSALHDAYSLLLQEGEFTPEERHSRRLVDIIAPVYWSVTTAIYLGWSFVTTDWHMTWLIWPVAGVLFGAVAAVCTAVDKAKRAKK